MKFADRMTIAMLAKSLIFPIFGSDLWCRWTMGKTEVDMKLLRIVPFFLFVALPASVCAQGGNTSTGTGSVSVESAFQGIENVAAQGGFVGNGRPDGFVGTTEIYAPGASSRSSSNARLTTPTARRTTVSTAQRQPNRALTTSQLGSNNQTIRSITSLDADVTSVVAQRSAPMVETYLSRIQGIQDNLIVFESSPTGTTAILTGAVTSDRERRVAQQLLLFEPGITRVDNRLEIR